MDDEPEIAVDSGASDNFGRRSTPGTLREYTNDGARMASATGHVKTAIATDKYNLPLPDTSLDYHVYEDKDLQRPLLSVGKACDAGCKVLFEHDRCVFYKNGQLLLQGNRDQHTGLYLIPHHSANGIPPPKRDDTLHQALNAYQDQPVPQLMQFLHASAGFPPKPTWIQAINQGYYTSWPGLTASRVRKYLPESEETALGHLKQTKQGIRSTSKGEGLTKQGIRSTSKGEELPAARRTTHTTGRRRRVIGCYVPTTKLQGIIGSDQTGRFPTTSGRGHKYIFILYDVDVEYIHAIPIKTRKASALVTAFKEAYSELIQCGFEPTLLRTDHETSNELIAAIKERHLDYEIVTTGVHRRNPAERAIQTFKSHFISIINGIDVGYPRDGWDYLIPQVNMTLNMLRKCSVNPAHSAYSYIHGAFDYNRYPLAPLGCRSIVHEKTIRNGGKRGSWDNKGQIGYYIGPAMKSYRCWRFYIPRTRAVWETDTAAFHPKYRIPRVTIAATINDSLDSIKTALEESRAPHTNLSESPSAVAAINRLQAMFKMETESAAAPRVIKSNQSQVQQDKPAAQPHLRMNEYPRREKQRHAIGTRVEIKEGKNTFMGTATQYDPHTGLYYVEFDDGEFEEFDHDELTTWKVRKRYQYQPRKPSTYANQVTVHNFFPKGVNQVKYCLQAGSIWDEELHKWMAYRDFIKHPNPTIKARWIQAGINEFARLTQGYNDMDGLNVVTFICRNEVPEGKQATYARYVVDYRPEKDEPWRLRITCGGDKLDYNGDTTTHSASMETIKLQLNDIVSTPGAKAATGDISNMYLASLLPESEYVKFRLDLIPAAIQSHYDLRAKAHNGYVYARVNKVWYGLKQSGKIAHDDLVQHLATAGYHKHDHVEGYFRHETKDISFALVVDDFLIKYNHAADLDHLITTMRATYKFKVDPDAKQFVGIALQWDYSKRTVRLSMPGYVQQALKELEHNLPTRRYYSPSRYIPPSYGAKVQYAKTDESSPLTAERITYIQRAVGKLLYYARAVDPTMLHAINDISLSTVKGTQMTLDATMYLLNYAHTYPDAEIIYRQSDMILHVDSDAAYLVAPEARSRAGGYQYLSNHEGTLFNGPVLTIAKVIKNVMASATEAELGALYMNAQEAVGLRNCLEAMGYAQPATPLRTDNNTANGIINNTMKQKRSKAIDVRFYWIRDRVNQGQFRVYWGAGKHSLGDFYTKHHPPAYHKKMRPIHTYVEGKSPEDLQGCIRIMDGLRE